jgi:hypothetical protein
MGDKYDRVTEILSPFSGMNFIAKDVLENAQNRGIRVHKACEGIIKGLGEWEEEDEIKGYIDSFKKWWGEGRKIICVEKRFTCDQLMITGQVDIIEQAIDGHCLVDLKTSAQPSKTWPLQGSAYQYLANKHEFNVNKIIFLRLKKDGSDPVEHLYQNEFDMFMKFLDVYRYIFKKKAA